MRRFYERYRRSPSARDPEPRVDGARERAGAQPVGTGTRRGARRADGPRPAPAAGEGERLREEILDAAEHAPRSAPATRTRSRSGRSRKAVGVTPPSIYLHFADKETLLWAVCERGSSQIFDARARGRAARRPTTRSRRSGCAVEAYVHFGLEHPEAYRIMFMGRSMLASQARRHHRPFGRHRVHAPPRSRAAGHRRRSAAPRRRRAQRRDLPVVRECTASRHS